MKHHLKAVIYDKRGRVLSIGENSYVKTHPIMARYGKAVGQPDRITLHAEVSAILKCPDLSKAHSIFVSRFNKQGAPRLAKPCPICQSLIDATGIKHVYYTTNE